MKREILSKTVLDSLLDEYPNETWDKILPRLPPLQAKEVLAVESTIDTLMNNGMFNLDNDEDYRCKGFDVVSGWEDEEIYDHNQQLLTAIEIEQTESLHEGFPEEFPDTETPKNNLRATHFLEFDKARREYKPVPMPQYARD